MKLNIWVQTLEVLLELHIVVTGLVTLDLFNTCIKIVLKYGYATVYCPKKNIDKLDKVQSKLIKQCLGLKMWCRNSPLKAI